VCSADKGILRKTSGDHRFAEGYRAFVRRSQSPGWREAVMGQIASQRGAHLQDRRWIDRRVLDRPYEGRATVGRNWGYTYPGTKNNGKIPATTRWAGTEYMRAIAGKAHQAGRRHHSSIHPALELLVDEKEACLVRAAGRQKQRPAGTVGAPFFSLGGRDLRPAAAPSSGQELGRKRVTGDATWMGAEGRRALNSREGNFPALCLSGLRLVSEPRSCFYGLGTFQYEEGSVVPGGAGFEGRPGSAIGPCHEGAGDGLCQDGTTGRWRRAAPVGAFRQPEFLPAVRSHRHRIRLTTAFPFTLRLEGPPCAATGWTPDRRGRQPPARPPCPGSTRRAIAATREA